MPLYEYHCENCGVRFEVIQKHADAPLDTCRACGGRAQRLLSAPAIHFKGSGWYITDYARKGKGDGDASAAAPPAPPAPASASSNAPSDKTSGSGGSASAPPAASSTPGGDKK